MKKNQPGQVRIIGGAWRGRKVPVPDMPGLRPSGDRGREVLFNWLQPVIEGADCLDLFAGSGALGFEAASRGARGVHLVEKARRAITGLEASKSLLAAEQVTVHQADALDWLGRAQPGSFDVVFIDPPFDSGLAVRTLQLLTERDLVRPGGYVYVEMASRLPELVMQLPFALYREKVVGEVRMRLFQRDT